MSCCASVLNNDELSMINNKYNFKLKILGDTVYIKSKHDQWYAYQKMGGKVYLYHKNKKHNTSHYHFQRSFTNFYQLFDSIKKHDYYQLRENKNCKMNRINFLLNQISL